MKLKLEWVCPQELLPDLENPRTISEEALDSLKESLAQYGFIQPVIYNKRTKQIVGGHQRVKAAVKEGLVEIPVIYVNWSKKKQKSANLALNRISGEWDYLKLEDYIKSIDLEEKDIDDLDDYTTGFTEEDLKEISELNLEEKEIGDDNFDAKSEVAKIKKPKTKPGDLYILDDKHKILCGDSTKKEDVNHLTNNKKIDITFTSPPYNLESSIRNNATKRKTYINESQNIKDWDQFLKKFTQIALDISNTVFVNIQLLSNNKVDLVNYLAVFQENLKDIIIWVKDVSVPTIGQNVLNRQFEFVFILSNQNNNCAITTGREFRGTISNVIHCPKIHHNEYADVHRALMPIELAAFHIKSFTKEQSIIYEPFLGLGTTLIAAEKLNRICYGLEIDPVYCDLIIERYKKLKPDAKIEKISTRS